MSTLYNPKEEHDACGVGFVASLPGHCHRRVVTTALSAMASLAHRGGHAANGASADGAGILLPIPREFFHKQWPLLKNTERVGRPWALGQLFLPANAALRAAIMEIAGQCLAARGFDLAEVRQVPLNVEALDEPARKTMPVILQIMALPRRWAREAAPEQVYEVCEQQLYLARRCLENAAWLLLGKAGQSEKNFHVASLSCRSLVYKGMLSGGRLASFYPDLQDDLFTAPFTVFHERFSTNTLPSWSLAQPFRHLAHNGEINTIKGNIMRMRGREPILASPVFGADLGDLLPIVDECGSDSAIFDQVLELLVRGGRSMAHALMMMVPEPFGRAYVMGDNKRAFYEYHAALMEPWDGPTAMVFSDGYSQVGALLDRNGLRPCRYSVDRDGMVVLASETGVASEVEREIRQRGHLPPRRMIIADVARHRLMPDVEIKGQVIRAHPYRRWLRDNCVELGSLHPPEQAVNEHPEADAAKKRLYGYSAQFIKQVLRPMAQYAQEPVQSMGYDQPLAILDDAPQLLFNYFKQQFAQVTNPPIDSQREELSMSLMGFAGRERNLLLPQAEHCALLRLAHPFLSKEDMERLRASRNPNLKSHTLDATFAVPPQTAMASAMGQALESALAELAARAEQALSAGATILIISDIAAGPKRVPIPALLATAGLHHHLLRRGLRHACGILVESGEASEIMHMALLVAYGASGVCPYLAMEMVAELGSSLPEGGKGAYTAMDNYVTALKKGFLKTLARLGISTLRSFRGAQTFEAIGLSSEVIDHCFTGTQSRLGGMGFAALAAEACARHYRAYGKSEQAKAAAPTRHLWSAGVVKALHRAVGGHELVEEAWQAYITGSDELARPATLRGLLELREGSHALALREVEPAASIVRRFVGAAMSLGSLSAEAHETVAVACNRLGARSNSGEGGEDPARNHPRADNIGRPMDKRSRIRQIASGRFGVTAVYLAVADEIQIKMAQGAKPGEGGQLPAHKVTPEIARARHTMPGVSLISPPPHHDIYSIEDLAQLIYDVRRIQPMARISVKLVAEAGVGTVAVGCVKAGAHSITISGHDGGTGASPLSAIEHVGLPWEMGLVEAHQALVASGLRQQVSLQVDGLLRTGRDLAVAALLGANEFAFGSGLMVAMGCLMCRGCHLGKCPVGIATQEESLRVRFIGKPEYVERYLLKLAEDMRRHMARMGFATVAAMVGQAGALAPRRQDLPDKAAGLNLRPLLAVARQGQNTEKNNDGDHATVVGGNETELEAAIMQAARPVLQGLAARCSYEAKIKNTDRAIGVWLSGKVARRQVAGSLPALPDHSICLGFSGSAGQSLAAFLARGITIKMRGDANDYAGKGLSGGVLVVAPGYDAPSGGEAILPGQAIIGNVALYGATSGQAYIGGMAGERFAVRNSGAVAVVEGVGDHGCEYMTGGTVVVIGPCGYNFAAGMSGGVAFVYDGDEHFQNRCNTDNVDLESVWRRQDEELLLHLLKQHLRHTGSVRAASLLANWEAARSLFVKVLPLGYEQAMARLHQSDRNDSDTVSNTEEVFGPYA